MQAGNNASRTQRTSESGLVWEEKLTNGMGSLDVYEHQTLRIRATGATTVTLEGILAMTMSSGEIAIINAGNSITGTKKVQVVIAGAAAFVQVARIKERKENEE